MRNLLLLLLLVLPIPVRATDIYFGPTAAGAQDGSSCANAVAYNDGTRGWNVLAQQQPGNKFHACGIITGAAGATLLTFINSGTSGNPITLFFEPGATLQSPAFPQSLGGSSGGAIFINGQSWIVIDGNNQAGIIRNTLNGSSSATCSAGPCTSSVSSTLIAMYSCSNCTVKNLQLPNVYVAFQNDASQANSTNEQVIIGSGSNVTISGNAITNCGWCINWSYGNNDTNLQTFNNTFSNFGHAYAYSPAVGNTSCVAPCALFHDNHIGPAGTVWDASGCPNHKDGIHFFGNGTTSTMDGIYVYNNLFDGDWGVCPTGFIFTDGSPVPNMKTWYLFNNVGVVVNTSFVNTNGWIGMGGNTSPSGVQYAVNNTLIGTGLQDNTLGMGIGGTSALTFENNTISGIQDPVNAASTNTITAWDYNLYGTETCANFGNCFIWHGSFSGSFSSWKTNCSCDAHSSQNSTPLLNTDGSIQAQSPVVNAGLNLSSVATGSAAALASSTTKANLFTSYIRPTSGNWDIGAYQQPPVFPGAAGGGSYPNTAGRGGTVFYVTSLADSGNGTLRNCINASGPRICEFKTGGTIVVSSSLHITNPYIYIAGQTAPGGGIQITNSSTCNSGSNCDLLRIGTHDVVIRYVRARFSAESGTNFSSAPMSCLNESADCYNVVTDHISVAWSEWDNLDVYQGSFNSFKGYNLTEQYAVLAEPRFDTNGGVNVQISGNSSSISNQMHDIDFHHNFLTGGNHRNPIHRVGQSRIVSNLIYNTNYYDIKGLGIIDVINNYIKAGPYNGSGHPTEIQSTTTVSIGTTNGCTGTPACTAPSFYIAGNAADSNNFNGAANQWTGTLTGLAPGEDNSDTVTTPMPTSTTINGNVYQVQRTTPQLIPNYGITADTAANVASSSGPLLTAQGVGASAKLNDSACDGTFINNRDSLDATYVTQFNNNTGHSGNITAPGTLPSLATGTACTDTLGDGIPDQWKTNHGYPVNGPSVANNYDSSGYTIIEEYLNGSAAQAPAPSLSLSPSPANYGNVAIGSHADVTITVTNNGNANEILSTPYDTISGTNAADFSDLGTGTCANGGTITANGGTCTIIIRFTPSIAGAETATVTVNGTVSASDTLNGTGTSSSTPAPTSRGNLILVLDPSIPIKGFNCVLPCTLSITCLPNATCPTSIEGVIVQ